MKKIKIKTARYPIRLNDQGNTILTCLYINVEKYKKKEKLTFENIFGDLAL